MPRPTQPPTPAVPPPAAASTGSAASPPTAPSAPPVVTPSTSPAPGGPRGDDLPAWSTELIVQYESGAANQFILTGNVNDRMPLPLREGTQIGSLTDFITRVLLPRFDVVLSYDLGQGIRVEKGAELFSQWPAVRGNQPLPREPRPAIEAITQFLRYTANLAALGRPRQHVGVFVRAAALIAPSMRGGLSYDLSALALHMKDWGTDPMLTPHPIATFLITENLSDLHPIVANSPRAVRITVPLPSVAELESVFRVLAPAFPTALEVFRDDLSKPAGALVGASLQAVESLLKTKQHRSAAISPKDLSDLKRQLVERDTQGLIEFIQSDRSLDQLYGQEKVKAWLRQDINLWAQNDLGALPMGYLICGPVGTGKTYMVECLAGSAGVPVVKLKNFRDKWVGSTEGNLETIFRLLHALGRCIVFIDEADQALGRRQADAGDSGVGGRVYSMMAEEMSNTRNRGKILWVLASSRPDLIEVDLKRPGRVDVKIPLFPSTTPEEGFQLLRALCKRRGAVLEPGAFDELKELIPKLLTPGAAEALAVKMYRAMRTQSLSAMEAARACMTDYQPPVRPEVLRFQIGLAVAEATDLDFVPPMFRSMRAEE